MAMKMPLVVLWDQRCQPQHHQDRLAKKMGLHTRESPPATLCHLEACWDSVNFIMSAMGDFLVDIGSSLCFSAAKWPHSVLCEAQTTLPTISGLLFLVSRCCCRACVAGSSPGALLPPLLLSSGFLHLLMLCPSSSSTMSFPGLWDSY